MKPQFHDVFMDGLTKEFHPNDNISNLFSNTFHDTKEVIQEHINNLKNKYTLKTHRVEHKIAAE